MKKKVKKVLANMRAMLYGAIFFGCVCVDLHLACNLRSAIAAAGAFFESCVPVVAFLATVAVTFYALCAYVNSLLVTGNLKYS